MTLGLSLWWIVDANDESCKWSRDDSKSTDDVAAPATRSPVTTKYDSKQVATECLPACLPAVERSSLFDGEAFRAPPLGRPHPERTRPTPSSVFYIAPVGSTTRLPSSSPNRRNIIDQSTYRSSSTDQSCESCITFLLTHFIFICPIKYLILEAFRIKNVKSFFRLTILQGLG